MSTIVDTSVWSHALRRGMPSVEPQAEKLSTILREGRPILLLGVILHEILQSLRNPADFEKLGRYLDRFPMLSLAREDYIAAAELQNLCRSHGVQVEVIDAEIAAACIRHDCALLTCDQDFQHIAEFCPLQLL